MADPRKEIARALRADEWVQRHLGIVAHARDVADTAVAALEAAGFVLLPPGGEVSTQWRVHHVDNFWREECATEEEARDLFRRVCDIHRSNGNVFEIIRRRVITTSGGFKATWPWEAVERHPVVSDNSEGESSG